MDLLRLKLKVRIKFGGMPFGTLLVIVYAYMFVVRDAGNHRVAEAKVCVAREPCRAMSRIVFLIAGTRVPNVLAKC